MAGFGRPSPEKCNYYAHVTSGLDRIHFDAIYWSLFFFVIGILFAASWIYQSIMKYNESPNCEKPEYDRRVKLGMAYTGGLFLVAAVALVIEVFCLLALQFCDGEDLMSLYWSTWTMLQLGSEIAVLGIVLALYHTLFEINPPKWALALGTPVLVVAGFGHVLGILFSRGARKLKVRHEERRTRSRSASVSGFTTDKTNASTATSIRQVEDRSRANSVVRPLAPAPSSSSSSAPPLGTAILLEIDTGGRDEDIRRWPSCVLVGNGRALIQATIRQPVDEIYDLEAQQPSPSASRAA